MYRLRVKILLAIVAVSFVAIIAKLVYLQIFLQLFRPMDERYDLRAANLYIRQRTLSPLRGTIRDRNGKALARGEPAFNVSVQYSRLAQPGNLADGLAERSGVGRSLILPVLCKYITSPDLLATSLENATRLTRSEVLFELCKNLGNARGLAKALADPALTFGRRQKSSTRQRVSWRKLARAIPTPASQDGSRDPQSFISQLSSLSGLTRKDTESVIYDHLEGETEWIRGLTQSLGIPTEEILIRADKIRERVTRIKSDVIERRKRKKLRTSRKFSIREEKKPYPIVDDIDSLTIAKLEVLLDKCEEITIETEVKRRYPYREVGGNIVGHIGNSNGLFCLCDIKDPVGLTDKLCDVHDPLSQYIRGRFSKKTLELLEESYRPDASYEAIQRALVNELNRLLPVASLYDKRRFARVKLAKETSSLLERKPRGGDLILLNRLLLGDAYPGEISKRVTHRIVGETGIEKQYNCILAGKKGWLTEIVNARGKAQEVFVRVPAVRGSDLRLTIDIDLQRVAEQALGDYEGSVVLMDPFSGEILALATSPRYDPNLYHEDFDRLRNDPRHPLLNRPVRAELPPGSVFKVMVSLAALEEGMITPYTPFDCKGTYHGKRCWAFEGGGHGRVALEEAIEQSCDIFFYQVGALLGIERLASWSRRFGLGEKTGIDLPYGSERSGLVPSPAWKRKNTKGHEPWFPGDTWNVAIGQGYVKTTPIQIARMMAAIANGGKLVRPRLLAEVVPPSDGRRGSNEKPFRNTASAVSIGISNAHLDAVRGAMRKVVLSGTAVYEELKELKVAAKTGTSQTKRRDDNPDDDPHHLWLAGYMPFDQPRVCFVVALESVIGGHGGLQGAAVAIPILKYFSDNS